MELKVYVITRRDKIDYHEYIGFVVTAPNPQKALEIAFEPYKDDWDPPSSRHKWNVEEITTNSQKVWLESYNAG